MLSASGPRSCFAGNAQNARFGGVEQPPASGPGPRPARPPLTAASSHPNEHRQPPPPRLDPYCRAQRPLFLSHPPRARALHPTRNTRWDSTGSTCVVDEPPRPPGQYQGVGLFAHGLAGNPRTSWLVPSRRQQWPDHSLPGDHPRPRTCRVGMVRPAQVRESDPRPRSPRLRVKHTKSPQGRRPAGPLRLALRALFFMKDASCLACSMIAKRIPSQGYSRSAPLPLVGP